MGLIQRKWTYADGLGTTNSSKLSFRKLGLSLLIKVQLHTVFIEKDGVRNLVTIDCLALMRSSPASSNPSPDVQETHALPTYSKENYNSTTYKRIIDSYLQSEAKEIIDTTLSEE